MDVSQSFLCAGKGQMLQYEAFFSHLETLTHYEDRAQEAVESQGGKEGRREVP